MTLECRILRKIDETAEGYNIVAEIVNILVDENYLGEDGKPQVEKMNLITYEPVHHGYVVLGERVGDAFSDGKKLKELYGKDIRSKQLEKPVFPRSGEETPRIWS